MDGQFRESGVAQAVYNQPMGVGFNDSAPAVHPPLGEVPPPTGASAGMNQRFALDPSSFEKLLSAAWVLQCLQDHLHGPPVDREETIAEPFKTQKQSETASPSLPVAMKPLLPFSLEVTEAQTKDNAIKARP